MKKKKLFGRDGRQAQLEDLHRAAERGGDLRDVDPELQQEVAAERQLMQQLGRFASESAPADPSVGRAAFLSAVARQRSESVEEGRIPMIGQLLGARGLALLAAAGIFAGGAVTVGASGGVGNAAGNANDVLATLHVPHTGHGHGNGNPNGGGKPDDAGAPAAEGTQRAVEGIPTENPQHRPADADGTCDRGETIVKTTPSGVAVNVPCQTAEDHGQGKGDETPEANATESNGGHGNGNGNGRGDETREADETPEAGETREADGQSGEGADHTPVPHPTQANQHASEGADNGSDR